MADALCGPSNALQSFQKHTSVDRTLQQDRLTSRHSPVQGFRSSPGPNAGILDPEFDAFQAGLAGPPQPDLRFAPRPPALAPQFAPAPQALDWASDFQRLNIGPSHPSPIQHHHPPQASNAVSSWHQDFMRQQSPVAHTPPQHNNTFGGLSPHGMAWAGPAFQQRPASGVMKGSINSEVARGKQQAQEGIAAFDNAAFERAFAKAQQDEVVEVPKPSFTYEDLKHEEQAKLLERQNARHVRLAGEQMESGDILKATEKKPAFLNKDVSLLRAREERMAERMKEDESNPVLLRIREKRPSIYAALKLRSTVDLGQITETAAWIRDLECLEMKGRIVEDASEAKWCTDALQSILNRGALADASETQERAEKLITAMNERLMSHYPLLAPTMPINQDNIWEELQAAGYTRSPVPERVEQQAEQKKEEQPLKNDDDEMAETAGKLLERVADNRSAKFQNSQFLELMRRLRDHEVRVEGDKMVEVNNAESSTTPPPPDSVIPPIDPMILGHSALDFGMPLDSEAEISFETTTSMRNTTDEQIPPYEQDLDLGRSGVHG